MHISCENSLLNIYSIIHIKVALYSLAEDQLALNIFDARHTVVGGGIC